MSAPNFPVTSLDDLAEAITDQPSLFDAPDAGVVMEARYWVSTGRATIRHSDRVARIVAAWLQTGSLRGTARVSGFPRNTISAVLRILESGGVLEPLKTRFERSRLEVGMDQLEWIREVIESRDLEAAAVVLRPGWVGVGIVSDKEAAQPPSNLHFHVHQAAANQAEDPVAEYERMLRSARSAGEIPAVLPVESAGSSPKSLMLPATDSPDASRDTSPAAMPPPFALDRAPCLAPEVDPAEPAAGPATPVTPATPTARRADGGGGSARARGGPPMDRSTPEGVL